MRGYLRGHPGIDFAAYHGQKVYAAHDGIAIAIKDAHGGEGIWLLAPGYQTIYWHLIGDTDPAYPPVIPFDNAYHPVKAGDLIAYADNTGAPYESNGTHLHFGLALLDAENNMTTRADGYDGCIDPSPYFNGYCAQDITLLTKLYVSLISVLQQLVAIKRQ